MAKERILIIEDNPMNMELVSDLLEDDGYSILQAVNGKDGFDMAKSEIPDLILLDVMMPKLNGFEVCKRIKGDEKTRFIPVVMITALREVEDKIRGIEAGTDDFLNKPVNKNELLARTKSLVRLKHLNDHLENTENVLFALAKAVEAKDPCTEEHLERMVTYSSGMAKHIGLSHEVKTALESAGMLHDIGKIGISESILCKPGPLTKGEFEKMKEHTIIGEEIVKPLRLSDFIAPAVRGHHERWDGSGYPDGLAGEEINIGARIISIIDAYDAMTSDRPYRRSMPKKSAINILQEGKRTLWDPKLVESFIEMIGSIPLRRKNG